MSEVVLCTSKKESTGMLVLDLTSGSNVCPSFKHVIADTNCLITVAKSDSSFEGLGSSGDYMVIAQAGKPLLNIYQWSKPQVHLQCHTQEIIEALGTDFCGNLIFGGTKRGHIYVWDVATGELLKTWHAHFKGVTSLISDPTGSFCISSSEDGMIRVWDLASILDSSSSNSQVSKKNIQPYRSWTSHSLPVKGMLVLGSMRTLRVASCSTDKTATFNDIYTGKQTLRVSFGSSLECMAIDATEDLIAFGSSTGEVHLLNISTAAQSVAFSVTQNVVGGSSSNASGSNRSTNSLIGHTKAVRSLAFSKISIGTLLSASDDGTLRWWNIFTRQCVKEMKPFSGVGITNILVTNRPEIIGSAVHKHTISPLQPLKKYPEDPSGGRSTSVILGPKMIGQMLKTCTSTSMGNNSNIHNSSNSNSNSNNSKNDDDLLVLDSHVDGSIPFNNPAPSAVSVEESFLALPDPMVDAITGDFIVFDGMKKKDLKRYTDSTVNSNSNSTSGKAKEGGDDIKLSKKSRK